MENKEKLGQESAFPIEYQEFNSFGEFKRTEFGMDKRFYAACAAVSGIMANARTEPIENFHFKNIVEDAYKIADELLKQENE